MIDKYSVEFILITNVESLDTLRSSLSEFAEVSSIKDFEPLENTGSKNLEVKLVTEEPTAIFDICAQFGRIKSVKINEVK